MLFTERGLVIVAAVLCVVQTGSIAAGREETHERMKQISQAMEQLLPLAVQEDGLGDAVRRPMISGSLELLVENADLLDAHAAGAPLGFKYHSASLARYAKWTHRYYDLGNYASAALSFQRITDLCVACHSRLPGVDDSALASGLAAASEFATLPLEKRAALLVATRQFDDALTSYEGLLADSSTHPARLLGRTLADYLVVCIRVKGDFKRPVPVLEAIASRNDVEQELRTDVEYWIRALRRLDQSAQRTPDLSRARELLQPTRPDKNIWSYRRGLISDIVASSMLHRFLEAHYQDQDQQDEVAEAYYLLGVAETRGGRGVWVSPADLYLETAIRLAPHAPFATSAYELLEHETILGYSGSSGLHLPEDVATQLKELRRMVEEPQ
ncbi:MAG: hypothetical protein ACR2RB_09370 [Gammaproteobacteria bacterium]